MGFCRFHRKILIQQISEFFIVPEKGQVTITRPGFEIGISIGNGLFEPDDCILPVFFEGITFGDPPARF